MRPHEVDPNWVRRAVISAEEAFALLGIDRGTGYKAVREGTFPIPVVRIGRTIRVPTGALRRLLGMNGDDGSRSGEEMSDAG